MENKMRRLVLIVEDDPALQKAMTEQLQKLNFDVVTAHHYDAAVEKLAEKKPHLICVDLELPTQSGYELCEHIRGPLGLTHVPILVTSDFGFAKTMAHAEEVGANAFLKKPFTMNQLKSYIDALLDRLVHRSEPYMRRLQL